MKSFLNYVAGAFILVPLFIIFAGGLSIYLVSCVDVYILGEETSFLKVSGIMNPFVWIILIGAGIAAYKFWWVKRAKK